MHKNHLNDNNLTIKAQTKNASEVEYCLEGATFFLHLRAAPKGWKALISAQGDFT